MTTPITLQQQQQPTSQQTYPQMSSRMWKDFYCKYVKSKIQSKWADTVFFFYVVFGWVDDFHQKFRIHTNVFCLNVARCRAIICHIRSLIPQSPSKDHNEPNGGEAFICQHIYTFVDESHRQHLLEEKQEIYPVYLFSLYFWKSSGIENSGGI